MIRLLDYLLICARNTRSDTVRGVVDWLDLRARDENDIAGELALVRAAQVLREELSTWKDA